jgi:hypothetical protein
MFGHKLPGIILPALCMLVFIGVLPARADAWRDYTPEEYEKKYGFLAQSECYDKDAAFWNRVVGWGAKRAAPFGGKLGLLLTGMSEIITRYPRDWKCFCERVKFSTMHDIDGHIYVFLVDKLVCKMGSTGSRFLPLDRKACSHPVHGQPSEYYDVFPSGIIPECQ